MLHKTIVPLALACVPLFSCRGPHEKMAIQIKSQPAGAEVFMSRRGENMVQAKLGFIKGSMGRTEYSEEFTKIGTTPMEYVTRLEEERTDATLLGFGGRTLVKYDEALVRLELPGFQPVLRHVRLEKGQHEVVADLLQEQE